MRVSLPKGSKEFLVVVVLDKLKNIEDLDDATVTYGIKDSAQEDVVTDQATDTDGMVVLCLVDTTNLAQGEYGLFVHIDLTPQYVILGPFKFFVDDFSEEEYTP
jgi:5-hydroxyisourate hydrolase-like protein (transthyretin family)